MAVNTPEADEVKFSIVLPSDLDERVRKIAQLRRTRRAPTIVWLIERAVRGWEDLSREQREQL